MNVKVDEKVSIQTKFGPCEILSFKGLRNEKEHIVLAFGNWEESRIPKVRLHSECLTGDVFGSKRCDCGPQLEEAMRSFSKSSGLIVYLRQEGRGIGLFNKLKAYRLQDAGLDTYEANAFLGFSDDLREFYEAAEMLKALGVNQVRLLSNNPKKEAHLSEAGIQVRQRLFTKTYLCLQNERYLTAKATVGGHDGLTFELKEGSGL